MRIGINLLYLLPGIVGGTETYAAGILQGLTKVNPADQIIVFVNQEAAHWPLPSAANIERVVCPVIGSKRSQRYFFEQTTFPLYLYRHQVDLVHSLGYIGPIISPCPTVVTLHDTNNYAAVAKGMPNYRRFVVRFMSTSVAWAARRIITISEFSKEQLCQAMKLPRNKISVIHAAPHPKLTDADVENWARLKAQYQIKEPYLVAFGGSTVHKNIPRLLQAFALLKHKYPHQLVLLGHLPPNVDPNLLTQDEPACDRIVTTGYVPTEHVKSLLGHADLFIFPSLYEGFGLPILEAQQAGVAVACSTAGSLPEVAGQGAAYFEPTSVEAMAQTIMNCLANTELRVELQRQGQENLQRFSWQKAATETLAVYQQVLGHNHS